MATPGKLRDVVAEALGLNDQLQMVDVHLRNLREAGLISKAKRGRGAAEVDASDATNLVLALAGSSLVKDSVMAAEKFGGLAADRSSFSVHGEKRLQRNFDGYPSVDLSSIPTFREAVGAILLAFCGGRFFPQPQRNFWRADREFISVRLYMPFIAASIHFGFEREYSFHQLYGLLPARDPRVIWDPSNLRVNGRMVTMRIIDAAAISKIAHVLKPSAGLKD